MTDQALPAAGPLRDLTTLADRAAQLEKEIAAAEAADKLRKATLRTLYEIDIPEVMDELRLTSFTLTNGLVLEVKPVIEGAIPVANRPAAFAWLRDNGHGGIIKNDISVSLGKGQDDLAATTVETLKGLGLTVEQQEAVHSSTMKSWAKELIAAGTALPLELLGLYVGRRAKIKDPNKKKGDAAPEA